jgi:cell shape-determining protein MreC
MARLEFSHRSLNGAPRGRSRLLFATVLILLIFALDALLGGPFRNFTRGVAASLWTGMGSVRSSIAASGFFARNSTLATENTSLKSQLAALQERAAAYNGLKEENDTLRTMLHFARDSQGVTAPVVSSYHASPYGTFTVGAGANDAIATGDLALSDTGYVVGRVADVGETHTLVKTAFKSGTQIDVIIGNAAVSATGEGGGNARVAVPRGIDVRVGDPVIAPGFGGHPVGIVGKVEQVSTTAEQKVYIVLPVNVSLMRFVYIVPSP